MRLAAATLAIALLAWAGRLPAQAPIGTWQLLSRTDSSAAGVQAADGPLGGDPIAWIIYDTRGHVAAQLMARDRTTPAATMATASPADPNNSAASGGYDAYFGTYEIDSTRHIVFHHLLAAVSPADVGRTLERRFFVRGDSLIIFFDTRRVDGSPVTRRLIWRRVAP